MLHSRAESPEDNGGYKSRWDEETQSRTLAGVVNVS